MEETLAGMLLCLDAADGLWHAVRPGGMIWYKRLIYKAYKADVGRNRSDFMLLQTTLVQHCIILLWS